MRGLVFLHIPKCGGSTIRDKIINNYKGSGRVIKLYNDNPEKDYYTVETFKDNFRDGIPNDVSAIIGHISYDELAVVIDINEWNAFSVVRDPLDRAISNLNYMRINPNHRGYSMAARVTKSSLFEYLRGTSKMFQYEFLGRGAENVKLYKLENYKKALFDLEIISSLNEDVEIKNITEVKKIKNGSDLELLSLGDMSSDEVQELKLLYSVDYDLYESAL
ncbi:sulfotransferase family 2 domain-containing protein [Reinekea marinisedimentorum]|uniref:Sulfotransferase family protein n=1 Tax=Reinekea marinisedimentorum TaxID=230495 RepID=A0A4R3I721_9GAMM|nr:sulfotransferase family 2 domain-containing protein [Reinekea marinisedimentorum]TCS41945.1 sulfotransferase family protein [Reinekea marinisedimentorum]